MQEVAEILLPIVLGMFLIFLGLAEWMKNRGPNE